MSEGSEETSAAPGVVIGTRHTEFYIPDGNIVFLVENTLFRIHSHFFVRESTVFRDMLALPVDTASQTTREGSSDEHPIRLPQVSAESFAEFLWVFYNPKYSTRRAEASTWKNILALTHLWGFNEMRRLAFRELDNPDIPVPASTRIALGERYDAPGHFVARAMSDLATRSRPLTEEEGEELGGWMTAKIMNMREEHRNRQEGDWGKSRYPQYDQSACYTPGRRASYLGPQPIIIQPSTLQMQPPVIPPMPGVSEIPSPLPPSPALSIQFPLHVQQHGLPSKRVRLKRFFENIFHWGR